MKNDVIFCMKYFTVLSLTKESNSMTTKLDLQLLRLKLL